MLILEVGGLEYTDPTRLYSAQEDKPIDSKWYCIFFVFCQFTNMSIHQYAYVVMEMIFVMKKYVVMESQSIM